MHEEAGCSVRSARNAVSDLPRRCTATRRYSVRCVRNTENRKIIDLICWDMSKTEMLSLLPGFVLVIG